MFTITYKIILLSLLGVKVAIQLPIGAKIISVVPSSSITVSVVLSLLDMCYMTRKVGKEVSVKVVVRNIRR